MTPQIHIAGRPMSLVAPVGSIVLGTEFGVDQVCGPADASFTVQLAKRQRPEWIARGAAARVTFGGRTLLTGTLSEPDWSEGNLQILGAIHDGDNALALDSTGQTSSTIDSVADASKARNSTTWSRPASLSATPLTTGDQTTNYNYFAELLAAWSSATARPLVTADNVLTSVPDPTAPSIFVLPGVGELDWASGNTADRLVGRWKDASGALFNTQVGVDGVEQGVDLTSLDVRTSAAATTVLTDILNDLKAGAWSNGLTVASQQLYGMPSLASVFATASRGVMVRNLGQRDPRPGKASWFVDFIPERTEWHVDDRQIIFTPRGMQARDLSTVLATYGAEAA